MRRIAALLLALAAVGALLLLPRDTPSPETATRPSDPDAAGDAMPGGPGGDPGQHGARAETADRHGAERELLVGALTSLRLRREDGSPVAQRDLERVAALLVERRRLALGEEPPHITREIARSIDQEIERLAGVPAGILASRLRTPFDGAPVRPRPPETADGGEATR